MTGALEELETRIVQLRARPLTLLCRTPDGQRRVMTVRECVETRSSFIHIISDDLDQLLDDAINNTDAAQPPQKG